MNYYALFLNDNSYIERCLTLIRFISNPQSYSPPHITLRLFEGANSKLDYVKDIDVTYLNVIEPGCFNIDVDGKKPPFVVYLRCESDELERIEYKPDFPFSRLHITLYEGNDVLYANQLFSLLSDRKWNFRLTFAEPRNLTEKTIGSKKS